MDHKCNAYLIVWFIMRTTFLNLFTTKMLSGLSLLDAFQLHFVVVCLFMRHNSYASVITAAAEVSCFSCGHSASSLPPSDCCAELQSQHILSLTRRHAAIAAVIVYKTVNFLFVVVTLLFTFNRIQPFALLQLCAVWDYLKIS